MTGAEEAGKKLDLKVALSHVDGDRQLLGELAELFLQDYPRLLEEMRNAILKSDFPVLERAAHTLKGRMAFFGIESVRAMALALELKGRARDSALTGQSLTAIEDEMRGVLPEFEALVPGRSA